MSRDVAFMACDVRSLHTGQRAVSVKPVHVADQLLLQVLQWITVTM
jgi:hypothetical protein